MSPTQAMPPWVSGFFGTLYARAGMPWPQEKKDRVSRALVDLLGLSPGDVVMDQCCGEGHLSLALSRQGMRVHGVDQSEDYIARARAMKSSEDAHFIAADASCWHPPESIDAAINWHTSIGYGGAAGARALVEALRAPLKPGKCWLLELRNLAHYKQHHPTRFVEEVDVDGWGSVVVERSGQWEGNVLVQDWVIRKGGVVMWEQVDTRCWHPSQDELVELVGGFGDDCVDMYADVHRAPLTSNSPRMVVLARKTK